MLDRILAEARALAPAARRLVLMRFLIYVGIQSCYFIGVLGTLTYSMDGEVASTAVVVALLNLFQIVGSFAGGAYLDARGPRLHFAFLVIVMLAVDAFCIVFGGDMFALTFGAACLGFSLGFSSRCLARTRPTLRQTPSSSNASTRRSPSCRILAWWWGRLSVERSPRWRQRERSSLSWARAWCSL